jgi:hypothetical protein
MKKLVCILIGLTVISFSQLTAQQNTATAYWKMEHEAEFTRILQKQSSGEILTTQEQTYLTDYRIKLTEYFDKMPDSEKSIYYKNRIKWSEQPGTVDKTPSQLDGDVYSGERSKYSQYVVSSGLFGFFYGASIAYIFDMHNGGAAALPLLAAGTSTLIPMLSIKDKNVSYNSLALSIHGKAMGAVQGAAFSLLLTGDNVEEGKLLLTFSTISSIAMGRVGYTLGRDKPWSQGRVALYSHYGLLMPFEGVAIAAAFESEDPRIYGAASLAFGAGGYYIANRVANWNDYTLGDIRGTSTFSVMNGILGFCIVADMASNNEVGPASFLIPSFGALGGTVLGHYIFKDTKLSNQQGRNVALATAGGSVMGLGLVALFTPDTGTPYYITGYLTGMSAYALLVSKYKNDNKTALISKDEKSPWNFNIMPQNIFFNRKIASYALANPQKKVMFLPAVSATLTF